MSICRDISPLLSHAMDRELSWRERLALELHLIQCKRCREAQRQLAFIRQAARRYGREVLTQSTQV